MAEARPLSDEEAVLVIAEALREVASGRLTREADLFLATVAAEALYDRLTLARVVLAEPSE